MRILYDGINLQVLIRLQLNWFRQEGKHYIRRFINLLSWSGTKKNCLTSGKSQLWDLFTKSVIKLTAVIIEAYHCCQIHTTFYQTFFSLGYLHMQMKLLGTTNVDFGLTDQRLIRFSISGRYWRKNGRIMAQYIAIYRFQESLRLS
jgi:hypothetical protein